MSYVEATRRGSRQRAVEISAEVAALVRDELPLGRGVRVPVQIADFTLNPGEYVFGYQRKTQDSITVTFYRASSGDRVGEVEAVRNRKSSMVRALLIQPAASGRGTIQVGRFVFEYHLSS